MKHVSKLFAAVVALVLAPSFARAVTVVVPTNYPTITAAIASGADVIKVSGGTYAENVVIPRALTLQPGDIPCPGCSQPFPTIQGTFTFAMPSGGASNTSDVTGFRITGVVSFNNPYGSGVYLRECRLDRGIVSSPTAGGSLSLRGCQIRGDVTATTDHLELVCCTILNGGLTANYEAEGFVAHNYVSGPNTVGISVVGDNGGGSIRDNEVVDAGNGIVVIDGSGMTVQKNIVRRATGDAYRSVRGTGSSIPSATFVSNLATDPAGDGFDVVGITTLTGNSVSHAGGAGVFASSASVTTTVSLTDNAIDHTGLEGIFVSGSSALAPTCVGNRVLYAGRSGISLSTGGNVSSNRVGRSVGDGIVVFAEFGNLAARTNTVYLNSGTGLRLAGHAATPVQNNIAYGNSGYGLAWTGAGAPALGCNDWFVNGLGAVQGAPPAASDLAVNPFFCDLPGDDVALSAGSPLAGTPCGAIGAGAVGCTLPVDAPAAGAEGALAFTTGRTPAHGTVTFGWRPRADAGALDVFDARGARVWACALKPGDARVEWRGVDARGDALGPGVYFARIAFGPRSDTRRIVLMK